MASESQSVSESVAIPTLDCRDFSKDFAPAYLSNGLLGIRPGPNPLTDAATFVSGFVYDHPKGGFQAACPAPYPFKTDIIAGGVSMLDAPDRVALKSQSLDMSAGELTSHMAFAPAGGVELDIEVFQFLSRTTPCLACQEIRITPSADIQFEVAARVDDPNPAANQLGIAIVEPTHQAFGGRAGQTCVFLTIAAVVSEVYHPQPRQHAQRMASWGNMLGFDQLHRRNRQAWSLLWQSRIRIDGDVDAQRCLDAAFFYVHSSCHPACVTGVGPMGLSRTEPCYGHATWDMEHWIYNAVLPVLPEAARSMLDYRLRGLPSARTAARLLGLRGAQFPWEGGLDGQEAAPPDLPVWSNHQVVPGVALAFWEYYLATGDEDFLRRGVWPVISETVAWIESRGAFTREGFEIANVGVAGDLTMGVRNHTTMNLLCRMAMSAAIECATAIGYTAPESWHQIAHSLVIATDTQAGVVKPHSDARVEAPGRDYVPGALQTTLIHDPFEYDAIGMDLFRKTFEFEEELRNRMPSGPTNPGSPDAPPYTALPLAACAAFFSDRRRAGNLFRQACQRSWIGPYGLARRHSSDDVGEYLTGHAALLATVLYGFTGLRLCDGSWCKYTTRLPEGWRRIQMRRIWVRGMPMRLVADHGARPRLIEG